MQQPKVILADEPIASLDPMNAKIVMDSLADINRREGITVVTNLHTLDTARRYCDRVIYDSSYIRKSLIPNPFEFSLREHRVPHHVRQYLQHFWPMTR